MKKKVFQTVLMLLISMSTAYTCDVCGSGSGGGYMGLLPGFDKMFVSVRYSNNGLISHIGPGGRTTYLTSNERFHIKELWGALRLGQRFRITAFIPVNSMVRSNQSGYYTQSGIGDVSLLGFYKVFSAERTIKRQTQVVQSLWAGFGIKAPTGKYNPAEKNINDGTQNSFQLGTGSIDATASILYDIRVQKTGINTNVSYRATSTNKFGYKYGNKLTANALVYHQISMNNRVGFVPNAGVLFEQARKDEKVRGLDVWETGGYSLMGTFGLECSYKKMGIGMNYQTAYLQKLGEGKIRANDRMMFYLSYSF